MFRRGLLQISAAARAPKKGKKKGPGGDGPTVAAPENPELSHIFNIYQGVPDPKVQPDSSYPPWLFKLLDPRPTYGQMSLMFVHGVGIENATYGLYQRFLKKHRKLCIKLMNLRLKKSKRRAGITI